MKKLSKKELQRKADEFFELYPEEEFLWATTDGQFFLSNKRNPAEFHAKQKKLTLLKIEKTVQGEAKSDTEKQNPLEKAMSTLNAKERIAFVATVEDLDGLKAMLETEKAKTVLEAIEERIAALEE